MRGKYSILIFSMILLFIACTKKTNETSSAPYVSIKFGYHGQFPTSLVPYNNQKLLLLDSIKAHDYFEMLFTEFSSLNNTIPEIDSVNYKFTAQTKNDLEHFESRETGTWTTIDLYTYSTLKITQESSLIYKISPVAIHGNDTLEISPTGDFIKIDCVSAVSGLKGSARLNIHP